MISINYIYKFLDDKQIQIDSSFYSKINNFERNNNYVENKDIKKYKIDKFQLNLPTSFEILFNKSINDFYYDNKLYKNKSPIFTFFNSILTIGHEYFSIYNENEKENVIKSLIKNMDDELFEKDLYYKFNYTKNKNFNKSNIQEVLKNAYQFKYSDKFNLLKEYVVDYLGINIYIFNVVNGSIDFNKSEYYLTKYFGDNINKYLTNFIIINENEIYKPIIVRELESSSVLTYTKNKEIIDNIWKYLKLNDIYLQNNIINEENKKLNIDNKILGKNEIIVNNDEVIVNNDEVIVNNDEVIVNTINKIYKIDNLKNLKIDEIKVLCDKHNINVLKKSDKTSNMIKKLKVELIADLLNII